MINNLTYEARCEKQNSFKEGENKNVAMKILVYQLRTGGKTEAGLGDDRFLVRK